MNIIKSITLSFFICLYASISFAGDSRGVSVEEVLTDSPQQIEIRNNQQQIVGLYKESHALLIGVSNPLNNKAWSRLPGVKRDIEDLKQALVQHSFQVTVIENPDSETMRKSFENFIHQYGHEYDNRLLFYFAGHGITFHENGEKKTSYLVPADAPNPTIDKAGFLAKAFDMPQIEYYAMRIRAKHALFLFDAAFSGSNFPSTRSVSQIDLKYKMENPVRQFITSAHANEPVHDDSGFCRLVISGINGEADITKDGLVTGSELGLFLQRTVADLSHGLQHPQYGKIRNPSLDKGDFIFVVPSSLDGTPLTVQQPSQELSTSLQELLAEENQRQQLLEKAQEMFAQLQQIEKTEIYTPKDAQRRVKLWDIYLSEYKNTGFKTREAERYREKWLQYLSIKPSSQEWLTEIETRRKIALVIGIDKYQHHRPLKNAVTDAMSVATTLQNHYGFEIFKLYDEQATRSQIISRIRQLVIDLKEGDNLLIYYAGHGWFDEELNEGYWIPIDSEERSDYLSNAYLHKLVSEMEKARHVFLVADSCFSGSFLTRTVDEDRGVEIEGIESDTSDAPYNFFQKMDNRQSRTVLTSGANEPVLDGGRDGHSVFAYYFLRALNYPDEKIFTAEELAIRVKKAVANNVEQTPLSGFLQNAGHENGQMIFVRK